MFLEFHDDDATNVPFKQDFGDDKAERAKAIVMLLLKIYNNPDCDFNAECNDAKVLEVTQEDFDVSGIMSSVKKKHQDQLVTVYSGELKDDQNINELLAISQKLQAPYLTYLADMYMRDRIYANVQSIANGQSPKNLEPAEWVAKNKHCIEVIKKMGDSSKETIQMAVTSFYHRIVPKLMLNSSQRIQDSLQQTVAFMLSQVEFVHNLANDKETTCPFQADACIAFNEVKQTENVADTLSGDDDDDDGDDDDDDEQKAAFEDHFGNVKEKLEKEQLANLVTKIEGGRPDLRTFVERFKDFKGEMNKKYDKDAPKQYPRKNRFCSFMDRRKDAEQKEMANEHIFFEPPANCNTFPEHKNGHVPLWFFDSSKTSIIPHIGYHKDLKSKDAAKGLNRQPSEQNITSGSACAGAMLLLSFHVEAVNEIRCYMYLNGQVARFFADDITELLPRYFVDSEENKAYLAGDDVKQAVSKIKSKLRDVKFEAFLDAYGYAKNK